MGINSRLDSGFSALDVWNEELTGSPAVSSPTLMETFAGSVFRVPTDGCTTGKPNFTICSISTAGVLSVVDTSPTVLTIEVWKTGDPCVSGDTYLVATCNMSITTAGIPICCESGTVESGGSQIFTPGDTMLITWRMDQDITSDSLYQIWKLWIRGEWTA